MGVIIKTATNSSELDHLYQVRHKVLAEELQLLETHPTGRIYDRYDGYPETTNIIVVADGHVAGGIRMTERSEAGVRADELFDFSPWLLNGARAADCSYYCLTEEYRKYPGLTKALLGMGFAWANSRNIKQVLNPAPATLQGVFETYNFRGVAETGVHKAGAPIWPGILDMDELDDVMFEFALRHGMKNIGDRFQREFFRAGELVIQQGDPASTCYVILDGEAEVRVYAPGELQPRPVKRLRPGEMFGELALLTDRPRTATVAALTELSVMVMDRYEFLESLRHGSDTALSIMRMIADRMSDTLQAAMLNQPKS
ncbi:MAG: hypothetical protein GMKNLPBB_01721 [Myxococcota bacterium]|nr:hypothetical protein [Myxococcota bacterium]